MYSSHRIEPGVEMRRLEFFDEVFVRIRKGRPNRAAHVAGRGKAAFREQRLEIRVKTFRWDDGRQQIGSQTIRPLLW